MNAAAADERSEDARSQVHAEGAAERNLVASIGTSAATGQNLSLRNLYIRRGNFEPFFSSHLRIPL